MKELAICAYFPTSNANVKTAKKEFQEVSDRIVTVSIVFNFYNFLHYCLSTFTEDCMSWPPTKALLYVLFGASKEICNTGIQLREVFLAIVGGMKICG